VFRALPDFALASGVCSAMDCLRTPELIESNDLILTVALSAQASCMFAARRFQSTGQRRAHAHRRRLPLRDSTTSDLIKLPLSVDQDSALIADVDAA